MTLVSIREQVGASDGSNATLSFDHGGAFPLTISDPFSEQQEKLLEWYFEEHIRFPFTGQVEAQKAAQSITAYGEALFEQVFADRRAYAIYQDALQAGVGTLTFEIVGSPDFHRLHWEALKDPDLPQPLALYAPMVRKNLVSQSARANLHSSPTINLLIVTARPDGPRDVGYCTMSRPLVEALRKAGPPVEIEILRPGTYAALLQHLEDVRTEHGSGHYHVVHLDVYGALLSYDELRGRESDRFLFQARYGRDDIAPYEGRKAFFFLEGAQEGQADPVEASELADLLTAHQTPIVILNACQSGRQAGAVETSLGSRLMGAGAQMVLAMGYSITVSAAELMVKSLYERLFAGRHLSSAMRRARMELYNRKGRRVHFDQTVDLEDWLLPVVYQNREQRLELREFTPEEGAAYYERRARRYREPHTGYGFVGRDVDVLQIERRLLGQAPGAGHNLLLLRGMGGVGKTTLLHHLIAWWRITGFVERVFYFGYDEWAWTRQQIMARIAKRLLGEAGYASNFQPLNPEAQQDLLTQRLRARRYLLILDNVESITGAHLAIRHTLPIAERVALRGFLSDLADGETLVLLGSRGGEEWLMDRAEAYGDAPPLHPEDVYELPGLDPEAASTLAGRVLEWHGVSTYREDADFRRLLDLLQGYPLALEVVLANLARQTPAEMLAALQAGDAALERGDAQARAESILRCVDFSHGNLSPETQCLLLCLAPFTAVVWEDMLEKYTARLWEQPALSDLPFERWPQVLQEAADWGLLNPHPDLSGFWRLQPVLPYFLKHRLAAPEQAEVREAIEIAFRRHYDRLSRTMAQLINSQEAEERQLGRDLVRMEYENLSTALNLALAARVSVLHLYAALSGHLEAIQDRQRALELGQTILARLDDYPAEALTGQSGAEFVAVLDAIARQQLTLKQYDVAETSYQKALELVARLEKIDQERRAKLEASVYHQLGTVAQGQRRWSQAEGYCQQALQVFIEFDDRHAQADTYHQLGTVAQEQQQWAQARDYFLRALETFAVYQDSHQTGIVLRSLAQLWQASEDASLPAAVASVLGVAVEKAEEFLRREIGD